MIRSVIWKEWREQRWKLALGAVLLLGFTAIGLRTRLVPDQLIVAAGVLFGGVALPLFAAMDLVAAERAEGTLESLLSLPLAAWRVLAAKAAVGAAVCAAPLLGAGALAWAMAGGREVAGGTIVLAYLAGAALNVCELAWVLAFGVRQPSEARAAVVGVAVLVAWGLVGAAYGTFDHLLPKWVMVLHPLSFLSAMDPPDAPWLAAIAPVQLAIAAGLFAWSARRFAACGRAAR